MTALQMLRLLAGLVLALAATGQAWAQASPFETLSAAYADRDADAASRAYEADAEVRYAYDGAAVEVHRGRDAIRRSFAAFFAQLDPDAAIDLSFRTVEAEGATVAGFYRLSVGAHESFGRFDVEMGPTGLFARDVSSDAAAADFEAAASAAAGELD